jgi:hypothetical protein
MIPAGRVAPPHGAVAWIDGTFASTRPHLNSASAEGDRASQLRAFKIVGGADVVAVVSGLTGRGLACAEAGVAVKLVAELRPGVMTETEVARRERNEQAGLGFGSASRSRLQRHFRLSDCAGAGGYGGRAVLYM